MEEDKKDWERTARKEVFQRAVPFFFSVMGECPDGSLKKVSLPDAEPHRASLVRPRGA